MLCGEMIVKRFMPDACSYVTKLVKLALFDHDHYLLLCGSSYVFFGALESVVIIAINSENDAAPASIFVCSHLLNN